jgi:hypothetical protein
MSDTIPSPGLRSLAFNVTKGTPPNQVTFTQEITSASWGTNTIPLTNPYIIKTLKTHPEGTDPFISAEFGNDGLGNIISTVNTRTLEEEEDHEFCNCTSTAEDANATEAIAIVFNCIDFRLRENITCNLNCRGYYNNYDEIIGAGVSLGYNGLLVSLGYNGLNTSSSGWSDYVDTHIKLARDLHRIFEIIICEHSQCGAYAERYGNSTISEPTDIGGFTRYPMSGRYLVLEHEQNLQTQNVQICGSTLWSKFNGTNGTIEKITGLVIKGYIIAVDGSSLTQIYYKDTD